jgi:hypothetical protein
MITDNDRLIASRWPAWLHNLHLVTGMFAIRGGRFTTKDRADAVAILRDVLKEMESAEHWFLVPSEERKS